MRIEFMGQATSSPWWVWATGSRQPQMLAIVGWGIDGPLIGVDGLDEACFRKGP